MQIKPLLVLMLLLFVFGGGYYLTRPYFVEEKQMIEVVVNLHEGADQEDFIRRWEPQGLIVVHRYKIVNGFLAKVPNSVMEKIGAQSEVESIKPRFSNEPPPETSTDIPKPNLDISDWKTYRNEKYGFEVKYPPDWTIDDGRLAMEAALIVLYDEQDNQIYIDLLPPDEEKPAYFDCPFGIHVVECKKLLNDFDIEYIREISTGQLELSNQQELNAYMKSPKTDIQVSTILTDKDGKPLSSKNMGSLVAIFNQILSTFKFID